MTATVHQLPGAVQESPQAPSLNLSPAEVEAASGGYVRPADQLKALRARGFVLAFRGMNGKVVLPRAHHDAVARGQYGQQQQQAANDAGAARPPARPDRAAFRAEFGQVSRKK